jgi:alpha-mannosidase
VLTDAAAALAACMDTTCAEDGASLLVYNPLAYARQDVVQATVPFPSARAVRITGPQGQPVPSQVLSQTEGQVCILFLADLPPYGAAVYRVTPVDVPAAYDTGLYVDGRGLGNHRYRVVLDEGGNITSIVDRANGDRELLAGPIAYQFLRETPSLYPAWNMEWADRRKGPAATLGGPAEVEVVEAGPVRVSLQVTRTYGASRFQQQVRLACGQAGERIEFYDTIDWRESGYSLKAAFPLAVSAPEATYNWQVGKIRRGNNDPAKFEVPAHQWFDLTDEAGTYGVTVFEDCKYGSDKPADHVLRLTLLYTPHIGPLDLLYRDQGTQDWGRHRVLYGLYGHRGGWQESGSERQALRVNQPPQVYLVPGTPGALGRQVSFLQIDSEQVGLQAMKQAEDRDTTILRVCELWGRPTGRVSIALDGRMAGPLTAAWETDGRERRIGELAISDGKLAFHMAPFEIKTFEIELQRGAVQASVPAWRTLDLPYNIQAFTGDDERTRGELPGGRSYPRELVPSQVRWGAVPLQLHVQGGANAVACRGQAIVLPADAEYDELLLLAAADEDTQVTLFLDRTACPLHVQAGEGPIGRWDRRIWDRPMARQRAYVWRAKVIGLERGYIKRDRVGWYATHMHARGGNAPYAYGYMFLYAVSVPPGTRQLRLPDRPDVRVYAATLTRGRNAVQPAAPLYDAWP